MSKTPPPPPPLKTTTPVEPKAQPAKLAKAVAQKRAPRVVLNAVEGWGKTSCAAHAGVCAILMARGETGYETLLNAGRAPAIHAASITSWSQALATVEGLIAEDKYLDVLSLDALGGYESLCHEVVCQREFKGDWGEKGFAGYQRGYDLATKEWLRLLEALDRLHAKHNMAILLLSHAQVRPFKNPMGQDYDRFVADCHHKTWGVTSKWADAVLFGTFVTIVEQNKARGDMKPKGIGGTERQLFCERRDAFDAKNRYGMPAQIAIPDDYTQIWATIENAMKGTS